MQIENKIKKKERKKYLANSLYALAGGGVHDVHALDLEVPALVDGVLDAVGLLVLLVLRGGVEVGLLAAHIDQARPKVQLAFELRVLIFFIYIIVVIRLVQGALVDLGPLLSRRCVDRSAGLLRQFTFAPVPVLIFVVVGVSRVGGGNPIMLQLGGVIAHLFLLLLLCLLN